MRVSYKGFYLIAENSWDHNGKVLAAILTIPSLEPVLEYYTEGTKKDIINELKLKANEQRSEASSSDEG